MTEKEMLELLLQKVTDQGAILNEQSAILNEHSAFLKEHRTILNEHSAILKEHSAILNEHSAILNEHSAILKEHSAILNEHSTILKEHSEILQALLHGQEIQKAEIDRLNITVAGIQGEQAETREILDNLAGDVSFLVRKAAKHDDDIRELKRIK